MRASRWVLYSGAKVAHTSAAQADQARMNRYTKACLVPPHGPVNVAWTLCACQWPVRNGSTISPTRATVSRPAVTYVKPLNGRMPKMLNAHTAMMVAIAIACGRPKCTLPMSNHVVAVGNQRAVMRSPMILPKIESTTDHPIQ